MERHTHRRFVSYIDKSREYYAAQGFEHPYRWARLDEVAFSPLAEPVTDARVGIVTTAFFPPGSEPAGVAALPPKEPYAAPVGEAPGATFTDDLFWDREATDLADQGTHLPVGHLADLAAEGRIGSASPRFYGVPTEYSQRRTIDVHGPWIGDAMADDDVDLAVLVPL
ncbi:MAG: hypothetical protein ACE367_00890 [Acidimicrobiales bacterium]